MCKNVIYPVHLHARQSLEFNSTWLQYSLLPIHWGNGAYLHTLSLTSHHALVIFFVIKNQQISLKKHFLTLTCPALRFTLLSHMCTVLTNILHQFYVIYSIICHCFLVWTIHISKWEQNENENRKDKKRKSIAVTKM